MTVLDSIYSSDTDCVIGAPRAMLEKGPAMRVRPLGNFEQTRLIRLIWRWRSVDTRGTAKPSTLE